MTNFKLDASVGTGGENRPDDVRALKERLVSLGYNWLTVNDSVDADLRDIINLIQSIKAGRNTVTGDGRVDVPGPTYEWLRAANAPRWQLMRAGSHAEGFVNVERADPGDNHDFGSDWMATTIREAAVRYRDTYLVNRPSAAPLTVNDVSVPRGGDTPDHSGHETGLACDLRLPRTDGTAPGNTTFRSDEYDRDATQAMLRAIRHQPRVSRILFNDPDQISENLSESAGGHDDHVHFEIEPLFPIVDYDEDIEVLTIQAIEHFDGIPINPVGYPLTEAGFQSYLDDTGVEHFTAGEMVTPNHPDVARGLDYESFLPPHSWWPRGAALALLADELRKLVGEPVTMRNWWRPPRYNADVGGADESDHIVAHGVDLDYRSAESRRTAESRLRELYDGERWLQLSLGLGNKTTHVGILSPGRRRDWHYDSYVP